MIYWSRMERAADRSAKRAQFKQAGFLRSVARRSLKRRKKLRSRPGQPPFVRAPGGSGLKNIQFHVGDKGTIVGPVRYARPGFATKVLEHGGTERWSTVIRGERRPQGGRYDARPFMGPANRKAAKEYPKKFRGTFGS